MAVVIYSARTGRLRRYITDAVLTDAQIVRKFPAAAGEAHVMFDTLPDSPDKLQELLSQHTGLIPRGDRYVLVTSAGNITGSILADPDAGDSVSRRTLVAHNEADIGWRQMRDSTFQRSLQNIDHDIAVANGNIEKYNNPKWSISMAELGLSSGQIKQEQRRLIAEAEAALIILRIERADREAPR